MNELLKDLKELEELLGKKIDTVMNFNPLEIPQTNVIQRQVRGHTLAEVQYTLQELIEKHEKGVTNGNDDKTD